MGGIGFFCHPRSMTRRPQSDPPKEAPTQPSPARGEGYPLHGERARALLSLSPEVRDALASRRALVALETTAIAHGLPYPDNLALAGRQMAAIRAAGAVPAVIGLWRGRIAVGIEGDTLAAFAEGRGFAKVSRRDLGAVLASGAPGATTVAGTMICAALAGIRLFATGGIGGVHRQGETTLDVSADLLELGRTPVAVVSAGAKAILDLPRTLEVLETQGVPVVGWRTDAFPAFYTVDSGLPCSARVEDATSAARLLDAHWRLGLGGVLLANPVPAAEALPRAQVEGWIAQALDEAARRGIAGKAVTPFLLARLAEISGGATSRSNQALLADNARVAAEIAVALEALD